MNKTKIQHFFHPEKARAFGKRTRALFTNDIYDAMPFWSALGKANAVIEANTKRKSSPRKDIPMVITKVIIEDESGNEHIGYALCSQTEKSWNRKLGNMIATGRARKAEKDAEKKVQDTK